MGLTVKFPNILSQLLQDAAYFQSICLLFHGGLTFLQNEPVVIRQSFMMKTALRTFFLLRFLKWDFFFFNVNECIIENQKKHKKQKQKTKSSIITISLSFDVSF